MNRAGLETFIMNMYRNIDTLEICFDFLCTLEKTGEYDEEIKELGGQIYYMPLVTSGGIVRHLNNFKIMKQTFKQYVSRYDVLHIHNYHAFDSYLAALPAIQAGFRKVIVHSHSTNAEFHPLLHKMAQPLLNKLPVTRLACSQAAGKWLFGKGNIEVISNGIDIEKFKYDENIRKEYRKLLGLEGNYVLGHVGRFEYVKNQKFLCEIIKQLAEYIPNIKLVFVGDGCDRENIETLSHDLGVKEKILFLGTRSDVNYIYQAFDVFVFPSFFEGVPLSIVEAETSGLPCVLSLGVPKEIDYAMNVYHEDINDSLAWVDRIYRIYEEKDADRSLGETTIRKAGYDVKESCEKLSRVYKDYL